MRAGTTALIVQVSGLASGACGAESASLPASPRPTAVRMAQRHRLRPNPQRGGSATGVSVRSRVEVARRASEWLSGKPIGGWSSNDHSLARRAENTSCATRANRSPNGSTPSPPTKPSANPSANAPCNLPAIGNECVVAGLLTEPPRPTVRSPRTVKSR